MVRICNFAIYSALAAGIAWGWESANPDRRNELFFVVYIVTFVVGLYLQYRYVQLSISAKRNSKEKE